MKKKLFLLSSMIIIMAGESGYFQKYKTAADSVKLNKEYIAVSNDILALNSKITIAQNNLPGYVNKANEDISGAQTTAIKSSEQSANAVNGDVSDARKAKRKAKVALRDAKNVQHDNNKVEEQNRKIASLTSQLQKKLQRLHELETMRISINNMQQ